MKLLMFARIILLVVFTASLILISVFSVLTRNFKDVPSVMSFMREAHTFSHISDIAKLQIRNYYPSVISSNFILREVVDQAMDRIITPSVVEYGAEPALKLAVGFANSPTSIIDEKVVVDTNSYKTQAKQAVAEVELPQIVVVNADYLINNLPSNLTLVDLEKHPNSILGIIIQIRTLLENAQRFLGFSYVALIISAFFLTILNLHRLKFMVNEFFIGTLVSGVLVLCATFIFPGIVSLNLPSGSAFEAAQNALITDALAVIFSQMRLISYIYLGIAVLLFLVIWFVPFEKLQKKFDRKLKRVHVPQVTIKVK